MIRVAINGFGRIGRNVLRAAFCHSFYGGKNDRRRGSAEVTGKPGP